MYKIIQSAGLAGPNRYTDHVHVMHAIDLIFSGFLDNILSFLDVHIKR